MAVEPVPSPGRAAARLARLVEVALGEVELSLPQYRLLIYLDEGSVSAAKLADYLTVSRPSVTAVVDGLVARGLVERLRDAEDRRRVEHVITGAGRAALAAADASVDAKLEAVAGLLPHRQDVAVAFAGLDCWRRSLDARRVLA
ncbi:MAG: MarR family winged helix-turn-helix transcriptional regulator, partial [Acidimicrobiales bacterium]